MTILSKRLQNYVMNDDLYYDLVDHNHGDKNDDHQHHDVLKKVAKLTSSSVVAAARRPVRMLNLR